MTNKQLMKQVFDANLNRDDMKRQILSAAATDRSSRLNDFLALFKYAVLMCAVVWIVWVMLFADQRSSVDIVNDNVIHINQIASAQRFMPNTYDSVQAKADTGLKIIQEKSAASFELMKGIKLPEDLNDTLYAEIYRKDETSSTYNQLSSCEFTFSGLKKGRNVTIIFAETASASSDRFTEATGAGSIINHHEVSIYQYEHTYYALFQYQNYYFSIETNEISREELIQLLTSIVI